jgi:hypothetical protein
MCLILHRMSRIKRNNPLVLKRKYPNNTEAHLWSLYLLVTPIYHPHNKLLLLLYIYIYMCVCVYRLPLWSNGKSSWLQIQRPGFDSRLYQIFWEVVGLERDPLSLVSTTEELLGRKSSGSGRDPSRWPRENLYPQRLALTWPTRGGHSVGLVRLRTQATEFFLFTYICKQYTYTHTHHPSM